MTKDYSWPIDIVNEEEYRTFKELFLKFKDCINSKKIYIFGAGIRGCMLLKFCEKLSIEIAGFIDNDINKKDGVVYDKDIYSWDDIKNNDNKYIIVSVENYKGIENQLIESGLKYAEDFFFIPSVLYDAFLKAFFSDSNKYLFMGDCIFSSVGINDINTCSLGEMLYKEMGNDVKILGVHGMPIRTFYHILRMQLKCQLIPQNVLLVVNTVMFFGKKNQLPRAQHTPLLREIKKGLPFEDEEFNNYIELTDERMSRLNTDSFVTGNKKSLFYNNSNVVKMKMKQNYMYKIKKENEGVIFLGKIADLCKENNLNFYPIFPPINYMHGMELFGDDFKKNCDNNLDELKEMLVDYKSKFIDMSYILEQDDFASSDTINEITNYKGREKEMEYILKKINYKK